MWSTLVLPIGASCQYQDVPASLNPLPPKMLGVRRGVHNAYRFLEGAHKSVSGLFEALDRLSTARRSANSSQVGTMKRDEEDVVRAAIVFAASGVDAAMTRLVSDAGPLLIRISGSAARAGYVEFLKKGLPTGTGGVDSLLRDSIVMDEPSEMLLHWWVSERTRSSFQGTNDIKKRVRGALGIPSARVTDASIDTLQGFFTARNQIVHDMDYERKDQPNTTGRRRRRSEDAAQLCDEAFAVAADLINATAELMKRHRIV